MNNVVFLVLRRMRAPLLVLIGAYCISIGGLVLVPGQDDQGNVWHFDFFHAFYFISITGPTIGFGEIPYPFTGAQRMWVTVCIYLTVISWLYAVGQILRLSQDPTFLKAISERRFEHQVKQINAPFWVVCGYGDTGQLLVKSLTRRYINCVVVETDQTRVDDLSLESMELSVPAMCGDAGNVKHLVEAGITRPNCAGVIAVTDSEKTNVQISVSVRLLCPNRTVIARAQTPEATQNLRSFNTHQVINPYDLFAERMVLAIQKPNINLLHAWLGTLSGHRLVDPIRPPAGRWIVCGCGNFGNAVRSGLEAAGVEVTVIENDASRAPAGAIIGSSCEREPLEEAGIATADGLVAGTDSDANNLSVIMTARSINPELYVACRQDERSNDPIFKAANVDFVIEASRIIAWRVLALVTVPGLNYFLSRAREQDDEWGEKLLHRIRDMAGQQSPETFSLLISEDNCPVIEKALANGEPLQVRHLLMKPGDRDHQMRCLPLMISRNGEPELLPDMDYAIQSGDRILFCGYPGAESLMSWVLFTPRILNYFLTGHASPDGWLWRKLLERKLKRSLEKQLFEQKSSG